MLGLFEGTAREREIGEIEITLNLLCDKGQYAGQLFSSIGDLEVSSAQSEKDAVKLAVDTGASLGTMELRLTGERLRAA